MKATLFRTGHIAVNAGFAALLFASCKPEKKKYPENLMLIVKAEEAGDEHRMDKTSLEAAESMLRLSELNLKMAENFGSSASVITETRGQLEHSKIQLTEEHGRADASQAKFDRAIAALKNASLNDYEKEQSNLFFKREALRNRIEATKSKQQAAIENNQTKLISDLSREQSELEKELKKLDDSWFQEDVGKGWQSHY